MYDLCRLPFCYLYLRSFSIKGESREIYKCFSNQLLGSFINMDSVCMHAVYHLSMLQIGNHFVMVSLNTLIKNIPNTK